MTDPLPIFLIQYSDSGFTNPHEVVRTSPPEDRSNQFSHVGAMFWGFESARHRATRIVPGQEAFRFDSEAHNWMKIGLGSRSLVSKITISTKWYTGNQVPEVSVALNDEEKSETVLHRKVLSPDTEHTFEINPTRASECLILCYHDGGIARINLFGEALTGTEKKSNLLEYASISHVSNDHYGTPADAIKGNREVNHMLGWESARSGFGEHALFTLRKPSIIREMIVDTYMHRLNAPLSCHLFGALADQETGITGAWESRPRWGIRFDEGTEKIPGDFPDYMRRKSYLDENVPDPTGFDIFLAPGEGWTPLLSFGPLNPDTWHRFDQIESSAAVTDLLFMHYPNGGIHGLKIHGEEQ